MEKTDFVFRIKSLTFLLTLLTMCQHDKASVCSRTISLSRFLSFYLILSLPERPRIKGFNGFFKSLMADAAHLRSICH